MEIGEVFINRKSSETFQTTLKCSKSMNSFTFSTGFQWASFAEPVLAPGPYVLHF